MHARERDVINSIVFPGNTITSLTKNSSLLNTHSLIDLSFRNEKYTYQFTLNFKKNHAFNSYQDQSLY